MVHYAHKLLISKCLGRTASLPQGYEAAVTWLAALDSSRLPTYTPIKEDSSRMRRPMSKVLFSNERYILFSIIIEGWLITTHVLFGYVRKNFFLD